jgi:hypothetical protein
MQPVELLLPDRRNDLESLADRSFQLARLRRLESIAAAYRRRTRSRFAFISYRFNNCCSRHQRGSCWQYDEDGRQ